MLKISLLLFQLITAKLSQVGANMPSDPDSSSDSSAAGSPGHQAYDGPNIEAENCLPGVVGVRHAFFGSIGRFCLKFRQGGVTVDSHYSEF